MSVPQFDDGAEVGEDGDPEAAEDLDTTEVGRGPVPDKNKSG